MEFRPDYRHLVAAAQNKKPARLPLYEHIISPKIMEKILGLTFADSLEGDKIDVDYFFENYCRFFKEMTYDTVSFEVCIIPSLPNWGAIMGGRPGPIQSRKDFDAFPWDDIPRRFWDTAERQFAALVKKLPAGMKAVGGVGNGVFEISEDLVGFEYLPFMQADEPALFEEIYARIGDLMYNIWNRFLKKYGQYFCVCRFGDDLGFKTGLLTSPTVFRKHIASQYGRIIKLVHDAGLPFLWHSCGNIFDVMDEVIALGIDAKHSNEDAVAPFETWISRYGGHIGFFGGIDVDILCRNSPDEIYEIVLERGRHYRTLAQGYALGSGNSIPDYIPVEGYLSMVKAVQKIRGEEKRNINGDKYE